MRSWVGCLLGVLLLSSQARGGEVVESFEDGTPRLRYAVDAEGRRQGPFTEYYPGGKPAVRGTYRVERLDGLWTAWHESGRMRAKGVYRAGAREGRWEEWGEDGALWRVSQWRESRRDGPTQVWRGKEIVAEQVWVRGELARLDGVLAFPRAKDALELTLQGLLPPVEGRAAAYDLAVDRERALRTLKAYRYLCEVPHHDVVAAARPEALSQAASRICAALGDITHEPPNVGWPEAEYLLAAEGAKGSNLHQGVNAAESVPGYMDDSDPTNIDRVGHRCWCLSPNLLTVGFGVTFDGTGKPFTAMWATDDSRLPPLEPESVAYPPRGWVPVDMFGPRHAWSVALGRKHYPALDPARVRIEVQPLDEEALPRGDPLELEHVRVAEGAPGLGWLAIFRPKALELVDGAMFRVTLGELGPAAKKGKPSPRLRFVVRFYVSPTRKDLDAGR